MEILRVEPTPSPNTMKIVLSNKREDNKSNTFTYIEEQQPQFINDLLAIDGVKSIFYVMDFLAIDKEPKSDWEVVLPQITSTLNNESFIDSSHKPMNTMERLKLKHLCLKVFHIKLNSLRLQMKVVNSCRTILLRVC